MAEIDPYTLSAIKHIDNRLAAFNQGLDDVVGTPSAPQAVGEDVWPVRTLKGIAKSLDSIAGKLDAIQAKLNALPTTGGGGLAAADHEAIQEDVKTALREGVR